jgi:hypothetical protein
MKFLFSVLSTLTISLGSAFAQFGGLTDFDFQYDDYDLPASSRIVLRLEGQEFRGLNVLRLKERIRQQHPHLDLSRERLERVTVLAKSRLNNGLISLRVGNDFSQPAHVPGHPGAFQSLLPQTFSRVSLEAPFHPNGLGVWQLDIRGDVRILRIVVELSERPVLGSICRADLINRNGLTIDSFVERAPIHQLACQKARHACQRELMRLHSLGLNPLARCVLR